MILFDGAMGTMLQRFGLDAGGCPDYYNISHPEIVQNIHKAYVDAGSQYITTNTFGSSPVKLSDYDLQDKVESIAAAAVNNAKKAAGSRAKVAGDMGPTGKFIKPIGDLSFDEACENYYRLAKALSDAGADCLIIETIIDIQEIKAALIAAKAASRLPVICQMTYGEDGRTIPGTDPVTAAVLLDAMGADVIGANCSVGPDKLLSVAEKLTSATSKPVIIQPNAGMPVLENGNTIFPLKPEEFASYAEEFAKAGVSYLGGCCGTTPEHIAALKEALEGIPSSPKTVKPFTAFTSRTRTVFVGDEYAPVKIGERINPTGRRKMREDIQKGSFVSVKKEGLAQVSAGAHMLDVNMGVAGIDQKAAMETAISQLSMLCPVPLSIDSTDPEVIEAALKVYPGRPLINSVNASDEEILDKVLHLAKKYGAAVLCLPLEKGNLPATAEERIRIAGRIIDRALKIGLRKEDLLLDPLVLTIGSSDTGARETLKTIARYKEEFGLPCVMGTSNVSFGLPYRPRINAAFLTMAFAAGMNAPIVNPMDEEIKNAFMNANLLLGFDLGAKEFIKAAGTEVKEAVQNVEPENLTPLEQIRRAVKSGDKEESASLIKTALNSGESSETIIKEGLTAAMTEIGDGYGSGKVFLPQVMMAAEAMQAAFKEIRELLPDMQSVEKGTLVIGTVKGDIHDLGKNIVSALMENSGYKVIDLGKDIEPSAFVEAAKDHHADLVGLCSLMTTTLPELENTVKEIKSHLPDVHILVGGAVVTQDYADRIGAPNYCKDGIAAVKIADRLTEKR